MSAVSGGNEDGGSAQHMASSSECWGLRLRAFSLTTFSEGFQVVISECVYYFYPAQQAWCISLEEERG